MPKWFLIKLRYQKEQVVSTRSGDDVKLKTITEQYLVDAVSHTEAEVKTYENVAANTPDFFIFYIHPQRFSDVFRFDTGETWYKLNVEFLTENDKGREKKIRQTMLLNAYNETEAAERLRENLRSFLMPYEITGVSKTRILEIWEV